MSIYSTALSQLTTDDLQDLLKERAVENVRLEFKSQIPNKDDTLKKLSSFANTFGGYMVVGAKAQSKDGRIEGLPGVDETPGFKQRIVDWCFKDVSPPIIVDVSAPIPTPSGNGKVCYVVYVQESELTPHFLNGRRGIWIRTDEFSAHFDAQLADEDELQHLFQRRKLVLDRRASLLERARKRFGTYAARKYTEPYSNAIKVGPLFELCIVPRFPARPLCSQEELQQMTENKRIERYRKLGFPLLSGGKISQYETLIVTQPLVSFSLFEANIWGMLFYVTRIEEDYGDRSAVSGIHLYDFVGRLLVFLQHAGELFRAMNFSAPILIETRLTSIRHAQWLHLPESSGQASGGFDDDFALSVVSAGEKLRQNLDELATNVLRSVFFSVNRSDLVDTQEKLQDLVRRGHGFNNS